MRPYIISPAVAFHFMNTWFFLWCWMHSSLLSFPCVDHRLGKTVREFVRTSTASPAVASQLFTQLLEGVSHCTAHDVAHRDLKSDNLLLDESCKPCPRLVIADFGCCLADERLGLQLPFLTEETSRGGNPQLMAPEVCGVMLYLRKL